MKLRYFFPTTHRERRRSHITFVEPAEIVVMWSPKAACTTAITWAFLHNGLLPEALSYSNWIHRYRLRRYQKAERYLGRLRRLGKHSRLVVKIVRNPFDRVVSSFVHAYRHGYEDLGLAELLVRPVNKQQRFSFREFVHYLGGIDLTRSNTHHRTQTSPIERHVLFGLRPNQIVRIEDGLENALGEIERSFGLPQTNFSDPVFRSEHHTARVLSSASAADRKDLWVGNLPAAAAFYDDDLIDRVAKLYAEDFHRYGYDTKPPK